MNIRSLALLLLAIPIFSGCNTNTSLQAGRPLATLRLTPQIIESSYLTQSVVSNYTKANINHLVVKIFKAEVQVSAKDVPNVGLDNAVIFANFAANSTYQVRCYAYKAAGTAPSDLISLDDSNSYTDVTISNEDRPVLANVKVKLIDSPFAAQGTVSIALTGGAYVAISTASFEPVIATVAGNGTAGYSGDGGAATSASLYNPRYLAFDSVGNLYITDGYNNRIRKVTTGGIISTFAGNGTAGFSGDGGAATSASLLTPTGLAFDSAGNLYFSDRWNNRIRKVTTGGIISTIAGTGATGSVGDGGAATSATFNKISGLAFDSAGNLYVADIDSHRIRKVTTGGIISTVAGTGAMGFSGDGGAATSAQLQSPYGVAFDSADNLYIADLGNNRIRKVTTGGIISTVAGTGATAFSGDGGAATSAAVSGPTAVTCDNLGNLYICDGNNQRIRKVTTATGIISTIAGNGAGAFSGDGGAATSAAINIPCGMAFDSIGNLYLADTYNNRVRIVF